MSAIFCPVLLSERFHMRSGYDYEDKKHSRSGFIRTGIQIQSWWFSCSRMAKGGSHHPPFSGGLQNFCVKMILLVIVLIQVQVIQSHDILHHHGRQCNHQHPKHHEVRDYHSSKWFHLYKKGVPVCVSRKCVALAWLILCEIGIGNLVQTKYVHNP